MNGVNIYLKPHSKLQCDQFLLTIFIIPPVFYVRQVVLFGPSQSYSYHNKRATANVWCATTTATSTKVMEDYSTSAFLQSFTRLSCEVDYSKGIISYEGCQLVKGHLWSTMEVVFRCQRWIWNVPCWGHKTWMEHWRIKKKPWSCRFFPFVGSFIGTNLVGCYKLHCIQIGLINNSTYQFISHEKVDELRNFSGRSTVGPGSLVNE